MELENTYELELENFTIYVNRNDKNLNEIVKKSNMKKFTDGNFDKEDTWGLLFDLISSRLHSEALVMKLTDDNNQMKQDNIRLVKGLQNSEQEIEKLLEKYNEQVNFIEENRHRLEG